MKDLGACARSRTRKVRTTPGMALSSSATARSFVAPAEAGSSGSFRAGADSTLGGTFRLQLFADFERLGFLCALERWRRTRRLSEQKLRSPGRHTRQGAAAGPARHLDRAIRRAGRGSSQLALSPLKSIRWRTLLLRPPNVVCAVKVAVLAPHHLAFLFKGTVGQFLDPEPVVMVRVVARLLVHHGDRYEFVRRTVILLDDDGAADGINGGGVEACGQPSPVWVISLVFFGCSGPQLSITVVLVVDLVQVGHQGSGGGVGQFRLVRATGCENQDDAQDPDNGQPEELPGDVHDPSCG